MNWRLIFISIALMIFVAIAAKFAFGQEAQGNCTTTEKSSKAIKDIGEKLVFRGISHRGHIVTIYLHGDGKFSALVHLHTGLSCLMDWGTNGEVIEIEQRS